MHSQNQPQQRTVNEMSIRFRTYLLVIAFGLFLGNLGPPAYAQAQSIVWTNKVNVTSTGVTLQKTSGCDGCYDAGAVSQQQMTSGGGYIEFSVSTGARTFVGLSTDTSTSTDYANINYSFTFWPSGGWDIREGYANWRTEGSFVTGDLFRISIENGAVKYYKNGGLLYTSTVAPTYPLVMDTSLTSLNSSVNNPVISLPTQSSSVVWTNKVNVTATGGTLQKTGGCDGCFDAGAVSQQQMTSSGGYIEFSVSTSARTFVGLSTDTSVSTDYANINYGFTFWPSGGWDIREGYANWRTEGTFVAGDLFRISIENGAVKYYKNGGLLYTSNATPTYPLVMDTSLTSLNSSVNNAMISVPQSSSVVWTNKVNVTATGGTLQKTGGCDGCFDAGAVSQQQMTSSGGYIEFSVSTGARTFVGLSTDTSASTDYANINYSFTFWPSGGWDIREGYANWRTEGSFVAGDLFRISIENGAVKYYKNSALLYTSNVSPTYPLVMDATLSSISSSINNAVMVAPSTNVGIKTDLGTYPEPPLPALPPAGGKFIDPTFGTQIMRVTDETDGQSNGTFYSYWPTFNMNNTKLLVRRGYGDAIYDFDPVNFTLGAKQTLPALPEGDSFTTQGAIWSPTDPNVLYGLSYTKPRIWSLNVATRSWNLVKDFSSNFSPGDYPWQMSMSMDGDTFAFTRKASTSQVLGYVVYRRSTDQVLLNVTQALVNEVQLDKSGRYLGIPLDQVDASGNIYYVRDLQTGSNTGLVDGSPDFSPGHGDIGTGMLVGFDNDNNRLLKRNMSTPHEWSLVWDIGPVWQSLHISLRGDNEGWALVGFYGTPAPSQSQPFPLQRELVLVKTDGSQAIRRVAHHRSIYFEGTPQANYWDTPRGNLSRDGTLIAFTSNWGGTTRQDLFIVKIPPSP